MKKKKVVLFYPNFGPRWNLEESFALWREFSFSIPSSLLALSGPLIQAGYDVKIIDARIENHWKEKVLKELEDSICLGVSVIVGYSLKDAFEISKCAKANFPDVPIVWGGWHAMALPEQTLESNFIDIIVMGQGEITFLELCDCIYQGKKWDKMPGLAYKKNDVVKTNHRRSVVDVNQFPRFPYEILQMERYLDIRYELIDPSEERYRTILYISSIGCPFHCTFCAHQLKTGPMWNALKAERVVEDIAFLATAYGINAVVFYEGEFFISERRVRTIFKRLNEKGIYFKWWANGRADTLLKYDDSTFELLKESGCAFLNVGVETGSPNMMKLIEKGVSNQQIIDCARKLKKHDIIPSYTYIFGLPNETIEDVRASVSLAEKLLDIDSRAMLDKNYFVPYAGTKLFDLSIELGLKQPQTLEEWANISYDQGPHLLPWISEKYLNKVEQLTKGVFLSNSYLVAPRKMLRYSARVYEEFREYLVNLTNMGIRNIGLFESNLVSKTMIELSQELEINITHIFDKLPERWGKLIESICIEPPQKMVSSPIDAVLICSKRNQNIILSKYKKKLKKRGIRLIAMECFKENDAQGDGPGEIMSQIKNQIKFRFPKLVTAFRFFRDRIAERSC